MSENKKPIIVVPMIVRASSGSVMNIIISTPISMREFPNSEPRPSFRLWLIVSTSFVTTLKRSPCKCVSK